MKVFKKVVLWTLLAVFLVMAACSTAPQQVRKATYDEAELEMNEALARMERLQAENNQLSAENTAKTAKRDVLLELLNEKN